MRVSLLLCALLLQGCKHFAALGIPLQIKAAIEGEIKGLKVKCEKSLELDHGQWGIMCGVGNGIEIKYRVQQIGSEQSKVEFLIDKDKDGEQKIIAAPAMIVKAGKPSLSTVTTHNSNIQFTAERLR